MTTRRWGLAEAAVGSIAAVLVISATPGLPTWAAYLALWAVMLAAVVVANRRRSANRAVDGTGRIQFRITWMDVLVGAFVGLVLRLLILVIELVTVGHLTSSASPFEVNHNLMWLATAIIAPALLAPIVEELFFRGLALPAIGTNWNGIVASSIVFSAIHLVYGFSLLIAVTTFVAGVVFALLAVRTRRLGPSITAHIVFNASLIALSEFGGLATFVVA